MSGQPSFPNPLAKKPSLTALGNGNFSTASIQVGTDAQWIMVANDSGALYDLGLTMRATPGATPQTLPFPNGATFAFPTEGIATLTLPNIDANVTWFYSNIPFIAPSVQAGESLSSGGTAGRSGVWHFHALNTVASTAITVNTNLIYPDGQIAAPVATTVYAKYSYEVVAGTVYTVAAGTALPGWIGDS